MWPPSIYQPQSPFQTALSITNRLTTSLMPFTPVNVFLATRSMLFRISSGFRFESLSAAPLYTPLFLV